MHFFEIFHISFVMIKRNIGGNKMDKAFRNQRETMNKNQEGINKKQLKKISFEEAIKKDIFSEPVYLLHTDGTREEAQAPNEIVTHYENGGEFGIEKERSVFRLIFNDSLFDNHWSKAYEVTIEMYNVPGEVPKGSYIRSEIQKIANDLLDEQECSEEGIRKVLKEFNKIHEISYIIQYIPVSTICFSFQKFTD